MMRKVMGMVIVMVSPLIFSCSSLIVKKPPKIPESVVKDRLSEVRPNVWEEKR